MRQRKQPDAVLGIHAGPSRLEAVLMRASGDAVEVIQRFTRQRVREGELAGSKSLALALPGLKSSEEADFTIEIGNGDASGDLFLAGEFTGLGANPSDLGRPSPIRSEPFGQQLREILAECAQVGYPMPRLAFCIGSPDVSYIELFMAAGDTDGASGSAARRARNDRRQRLGILKAQHQGAFDEARVAFLPMAPRKGQRRELAIVPEPHEPVTLTLEALRSAQKAQPLAPQLLSSELSLLGALVRQVRVASGNERTAVVRISGEDTLLLFFEGIDLRHFERLRSLTTYDPAETICSRVLLQQDEQKIGEIHHVLVLTENRGEHFREAFQKYYPNASVQPLQQLLGARGLKATDDEDGLRAASVPATIAAVSLLQHWEADGVFCAVNLMPKKLRRQARPPLAFAWHTFAVLPLLFVATLFFVTQYLGNEAEIERSRQELSLLPAAEPGISPEVVQARVDSLKRVYAQYTRALTVLDSLLVGSDQWSRFLEKTARSTRDLQGVWFERWQPAGSQVRLEGNATSRPRVAQLARRLGASIQGTAFREVNDVRIYSFDMVAPRPIEMPRVADYLRYFGEEQLEARDQAPAADPAAPGSPDREKPSND